MTKRRKREPMMTTMSFKLERLVEELEGDRRSAALLQLVVMLVGVLLLASGLVMTMLGLIGTLVFFAPATSLDARLMNALPGVAVAVIGVVVLTWPSRSAQRP